MVELSDDDEEVRFHRLFMRGPSNAAQEEVPKPKKAPKSGEKVDVKGKGKARVDENDDNREMEVDNTRSSSNPEPQSQPKASTSVKVRFALYDLDDS